MLRQAVTISPDTGLGARAKRRRFPLSRGRFCSIAGSILLLLAVGSQIASAIPAFAKKTGLRCPLHEAWPKLNAFGQNFRDNGYQIGNERDSRATSPALLAGSSLYPAVA